MRSCRILSILFLLQLAAPTIHAQELFENRGLYLEDPRTEKRDFTALAAGDFNGDGLLDVGGTLRFKDLAVLLQEAGDPGWRETFFVIEDHDMDYAYAVAADLNADGLDDIACLINQELHVLLGSPTGELGQLEPQDLELNLDHLSTADMTGDGLPDLLASSPDTDKGVLVFVLPGDGDGTFSSAIEIGSDVPAGEHRDPSPVHSGDFDEDSRLDIAVAANDGVKTRLMVMLAEEGPTFTEVWSTELTGTSMALEVADLDADGALDLVLASQMEPWFASTGSSTITIFAGAGDGSLEVRGSAEIPVSTRGLDTGDLDGDRVLDLVATTESGRLFSWQVVENFELQRKQTCVGSHFPPALHDVDGDGELDVLLAGNGDYGQNAPVLLRGRGDGTLVSAPAIHDLQDSDHVGLGRVDDDEILDLVVVVTIAHPEDATTLEVHFWRGDEKVEFTPGESVDYHVGRRVSPYELHLGDVGGDGALDVVLVDGQATGPTEGRWLNVLVFTGHGDGTFEFPELVQTTIPDNARLGTTFLRDLDGDDREDLVVLFGHPSGGSPRAGVLMLKARGDATLEPSGWYATEYGPFAAGLEDIDGDSVTDLLVLATDRLPGGQGAVFYPGVGDGTFAEPVTGADNAWNPRPRLDIVDWNGDGWHDILSGKFYYQGRGDGTFGERILVESLPEWPDIRPVDVDRDGALDVILALDSLHIAFGNGDGSVGRRLISAGTRGERILSGDIDGDGWTDVITVGDHVAIHRNTGQTAPRFQRGDSNADGETDLADAVTTLMSLFLGEGDGLVCEKVADTDDDGVLNLTDAVYLLNYLFQGGPALPGPVGHCGPDPTPDALTCEAFPPCG